MTNCLRNTGPYSGTMYQAQALQRYRAVPGIEVGERA
jgi:hypothetical protein